LTKAALLRRTAFAFASLSLAAIAHAQTPVIPAPGPGDARIREVMYDENQIVQVRARLGYEMMIEFDTTERIENVSIGDAQSWQVTPNRKATLLFIKPMSKTSPTSMTVVTNKRIYSFQLQATEVRTANDPDAMFRLRFLYPAPPALPAPPPPPPAPPPPKPEDFNFAYSYKGVKTVYPIRVFDDGKSTFFEFASDKDTPAVFVIGLDGKEELANTRAQGRYAVADIVAKTFVVRYGKAKAEVTNTAWRESTSGNRSSPPPADQLPRSGGQ
jgi:type IV secretion system protein VirB9